MSGTVFQNTADAATKTIPEKIFRDVARDNQFVSGTTANDVFTYAGPLSRYDWGPTQDGKGIVVWTRSGSDDTFDILEGFEKLRFSDKTVDLTGTTANTAPVLNTPIADHALTPGYSFAFSLPEGTFKDADGDKLSYAATLADGSPLPSWLKFDPATGKFSGHLQSKVDDVVVRVTASDGKGGVASDDFLLDILNNNHGGSSNHAPTVATPIADRPLTVGYSFAFSFPEGTFKDADGDKLSYTATLADGSPLPSWLKFDPATGKFSGQLLSKVDDVVVRVTASDGKGGTVSDDFLLDILNNNHGGGGNHAPTVATPIADQNAIHTWKFTFALPANTFTDADGDALTISAKLADGSPLPAWLTFDPATRTFSGTPGGTDTGKTFAIAVTASDGAGGTVTDTFDVQVDRFDRPPRVWDPIQDQSSTAGSSFSFTVPNGTFADDNIVSYSATLADGSALPAWLKFNATTHSFSGVSPAGQGGSYDIKVTAHDASGNTGSDVFKLTIGSKSAETLHQNTAANQHIDGGAGQDVFVLGGNSASYNWGPTDDGKGVVVWNSKGFDILVNFEELRFTNKSVSVASILGNGSADVLDDAEHTQYLTGKTNADRFILDGDADDYGWGVTQDGRGVVIWNTVTDNPHDILTGFEKLVFDDQIVDISGLGQV